MCLCARKTVCVNALQKSDSNLDMYKERGGGGGGGGNGDLESGPQLHMQKVF